MGAFSIGSVVLLPFPFSDLSRSKRRPALVLARAELNDWILCQITSKPYFDPDAVCINDDDFISGTLRVKSYVRTRKLFTANETLFVGEVGKLKSEKTAEILEHVICLFRQAVLELKIKD